MDENAQAYTRALFGVHARQAGFNYVVQGAGAEGAAIVGTTSYAQQMSFGAMDQGTHILVLSDIIIRPHLVIASNHLQGAGVSGILKSGIADVEGWLKHGKVIIDNLPKNKHAAYHALKE